MGEPFPEQVTPGGVLVYPAIKSPNFVHGSTGWAVNSDGSAEFHDIELPAGSGGATIYFASTAPVGANVGDLWYNTADGLELSQWNGSSWVAYQIGSGAIATGGVSPSNISSLTASLIGGLGVLNPNPYFTGGDSTGWTVSSGGTFSVTASPPASAPSTWAAKVNLAAQFQFLLGAPFSVNHSTQYQATAWLYSATAQTLAIGMGWHDSAGGNFGNSETAVAIPAATWTPVSWVVTTGALAANANIYIKGYDNPPAQFYAANLLVMPQVPGSLIQAGTVTAAQIAANTITAGQLAAGIVYAGIVDGTTITAGTFKGADFIINSAGEFFYSGTPAFGNLLVTTAATATSDSFGNAVIPGGTTFYSGGMQAFFFNGNGCGFYTAPGAGGPWTAQGGISQVSGGGVAIGGPGVFEVNIPINGALIALEPGTASTPETWHTITLDSGWSVPSGFDAPRYRLLPDGNVQLAGAAQRTAFTSNTALNSGSPLPTGYQPVNTHHFRGFDASTGTARSGVQIAATGVITALATASTSASLCEIDGIIPLN